MGARITRIVKRLLAILACLLGGLLLAIAWWDADLALRALAITAGLCLLIHGAIRFWLLRRRRWTPADPLY